MTTEKNLCTECYRSTCMLHPSNEENFGHIKFRMIECQMFLTDCLEIPEDEPVNLDRACDSLGPLVPTAEDIYNENNAPSFGDLIAELNLRGLEFKRSLKELVEQKAALSKMVHAFMEITAETSDSDTHRACDQLIGENDELLTSLGITL